MTCGSMTGLNTDMMLIIRGGGFKAESSTKKCSRGGKAFCCEAGDFKNLVSGCYWTKW